MKWQIGVVFPVFFFPRAKVKPGHIHWLAHKWWEWSSFWKNTLICVRMMMMMVCNWCDYEWIVAKMVHCLCLQPANELLDSSSLSLASSCPLQHSLAGCFSVAHRFVCAPGCVCHLKIASNWVSLISDSLVPLAKTPTLPVHIHPYGEHTSIDGYHQNSFVDCIDFDGCTNVLHRRHMLVLRCTLQWNEKYTLFSLFQRPNALFFE